MIRLLHKIKDAAISIIPVSLIVFILMLVFNNDFSITQIFLFLGSSLGLIFGISLFTLGADLSMEPMGDQIGSSLIKTKKVWLIVLVCFIMGLLITIAEPDLSVLAGQVGEVFGSSLLLIVFVGLGVGLFLVFGILKIVFRRDLTFLLLFFYLILFALTSFVIINGHSSLLSITFDSGGVTTGPITVPFIMAFGVGVASTIGGRDQKENSFGLVALCSIGPIIAVMALAIVAKDGSPIFNTSYETAGSVGTLIFTRLLSIGKEVLIALGLIVAVFFIINILFIKLSKQKLMKIGSGIILTFFGLVIFLTSAQTGFMPVGFKLGKILADFSQPLLIGFSFLIGLVVVIAEPAILVLTNQVEQVTTGGISKKAMLIALSIGVGIAIMLSTIRMIFKFSILYYIVPGYILALGLSFFVPKLYTVIAFDSGGVASGPLTSSFILPLTVGACAVINPSEIYEYAFGVVAMVAMTPLITIQLLGFKDIIVRKVKRSNRNKQLLDSRDEVIITFQ